MQEMKDSGIKWASNIPVKWKSKRVKYNFENHKYVPGIKADKYDRLALTLKGVVHRSKDDADGLQPKDFYTYQLLRKSELVFKLIDLQNVSTSRVGLAYNTGLVSPAYIILKANGEVLSAFAEKYFLMLWHREIFNALGDNGVRSNLGATDLLNVSICYPDVKEQQQIVCFLDSKCAEIDSLHADIEKQIDILEQYKKSVITEAVTKGIDPNAEMKNSGVKWIGKIPKDWLHGILKRVLKDIKDGTHGTFARVDNGEFLLSAKNISDNSIVFGNNESLISKEDYNAIVGNGFPKYGDILICIVGTIGRCCLFNYDRSFAFQRSVCFLRCNNFKVITKYILYLLKSQIAIDSELLMAHGSAQLGLYIDDVKKINILCPSLEEQQQIADYLDTKCAKIDSAIADKKKQLETLKVYKKSLIYEYVTGKKEVVT